MNVAGVHLRVLTLDRSGSISTSTRGSPGWRSRIIKLARKLTPQGEFTPWSKMQNLDSQPDLDTLIGATEAVLLKHGATCPVSAHAREELATFAASHPDVTIGALEVTAHGDLSMYVAERLGIEHESPQVIFIRDGQVVWHSEHFAITADRLGARLKR